MHGPVEVILKGKKRKRNMHPLLKWTQPGTTGRCSPWDLSKIISSGHNVNVSLTYMQIQWQHANRCNVLMCILPDIRKPRYIWQFIVDQSQNIWIVSDFMLSQRSVHAASVLLIAPYHVKEIDFVCMIYITIDSIMFMTNRSRCFICILSLNLLLT